MKTQYSLILMLWLIKTIILSISLIIGINLAFSYIKTTITTSKTKDIISFQIQKYKNITESLVKTSKKSHKLDNPVSETCEYIGTNDTTPIEMLPETLSCHSQLQKRPEPIEIDFVRMENSLIDKLYRNNIM